MLDRHLELPPNHNEVSAGIRPIPGTEAASAFQELEQHPDWEAPQALVLVAPLQPDTNPLCLAVDGDKHSPNTTKDSLNLNHYQYGFCTCYLIPESWFIGEERIVDGDNGEARQPLAITADSWLRANPKTAETVLGEEHAALFLGKTLSGVPRQAIPLKEAVSRWQEQQDKKLAPMQAYEHSLAKAKECYKNRQAPEMLQRATELLESCLPLTRSALKAFKCYDLSLGNGDSPRWGEAFIQLAIIYEKGGRLKDAIEVCQSARDAGWGGDWEHRLTRLKRKEEKHKKIEQ